jgi:hypothetical protein
MPADELQAAQAARREITAALGGCSRASLKARVILREAYEGKIRLIPETIRSIR